MKRLMEALLALLLVLAIGCSTAAANTYETNGSYTATDAEQQTAVPADAPEPPVESTETQHSEEETTMKNPIATITMKDGGVMKLELYPDMAPNTVKNFIALANAGFYDGLTFHRIYAGFMIQGGDPEGNGTGGPGYSIKGEFAANGVDNTISHKRGVISMARAQDPDSAGSQFFIMHADGPFLDGQYAAFGMLIEGFTTLDAIAATPTTYQGREKSLPLVDVVIESIRVDTFGVDYGEPEKIR